MKRSSLVLKSDTILRPDFGRFFAQPICKIAPGFRTRQAFEHLDFRHWLYLFKYARLFELDSLGSGKHSMAF